MVPLGGTALTVCLGGPTMRRSPRLALLGTAGVLSAGLTALAPVASATPASFSSVNETVDGPDHCVHGNPAVNCNAYDGKQYVWLNGGPGSGALGQGDGDYF